MRVFTIAVTKSPPPGPYVSPPNGYSVVGNDAIFNTIIGTILRTIVVEVMAEVKGFLMISFSLFSEIPVGTLTRVLAPLCVVTS